MPVADSPAPPPARPPRSALRLWLRVVVLALVAALVIRLFVAEAFRIPTPSMEKTLLVGDFLLVSKLHYGPRTPNTFGIPFTDWVLPIELASVRLPGLSAVQRGDIIVFNLPTERGPVDRKTPFIKRVAGLPGDTVALVGKEVRVTREAQPLPEGAQQNWLVRLDPTVPFSPEAFREVGVRAPIERASEGDWLVQMTLAQADTVARWPVVLDLHPLIAKRPDPLFPFGVQQTVDEYGPITVPRAGQTIRLDGDTWPTLRDVITRYEGHTARRFADGRFEIDGTLAQTYTVEQDYYFVMGDNRDDSSDSRRWGFVPRGHVVGKAVLVYFSWDAREKQPRWERVFRSIR